MSTSANISDRSRMLTLRELEILRMAQDATDRDSRGNGGWFTPMDIGGEDGSDHGRILRRLVDERFNLIDEKFRDTFMAAMGSRKAGRFYRITEAGQDYVAAAEGEKK